MRIAISCLLLLSWATPACAGPAYAAPATALLQRADLLADADVLQLAREAPHPGLYRYSTSAQTRAQFDASRLALDHDQSTADAFVALSRFTATVRCGHTYPNADNQSEPVQHALPDPGIVPDVVVEATIADIEAGREVERAAVAGQLALHR